MSRTPGHLRLWVELWCKPGRAGMRPAAAPDGGGGGAGGADGGGVPDTAGGLARRGQPLQLAVVPLELWYHVLSMLETHQLGGSGGGGM